MAEKTSKEVMETQIENLDKKMSDKFRNVYWILGIMVTIMLAVGGGLFASITNHVNNDDVHRTKQELKLDEDWKAGVMKTLDRIESKLDKK